MKILHVISSCGRELGGTSEVVPRLARAQKEIGHDVALAAFASDQLSHEAERAQAAGVRFQLVDLCSHLPMLSTWGYSAIFARAIRPLVAEADIVHLHGLWQYPAFAAARLCWQLKKPYVVMPHGFLEPERLKISSLKKKIAGAFFDNRMLRRATALVATSESEAKGIRAYGLTQPIHIMPIGLDVANFHRGCRSESSGGRTLLYFSRITPIKGLDLLAEAWAKVVKPGWKLLLVGPDDRGHTGLMKRLYAERCAKGSYEFREPVYGDAKYALLGSVDGFVLPTRSENWSIAVAEAMASGLPVVCTKGAPWACLETAGAGWWVDVSAEAIGEGLEKLMALSDDARAEMGTKGRRWVEENLDWRAIAAQMVRGYRGERGSGDERGRWAKDCAKR